MNYSKEQREQLFGDLYWDARLDYVRNEVENDVDYINTDHIEAFVSCCMFIVSPETVRSHLRSLGYKTRREGNYIYFKR